MFHKQLSFLPYEKPAENGRRFSPVPRSHPAGLRRSPQRGTSAHCYLSSCDGPLLVDGFCRDYMGLYYPSSLGDFIDFYCIIQDIEGYLKSKNTLSWNERSGFCFHCSPVAVVSVRCLSSLQPPSHVALSFE